MGRSGTARPKAALVKPQSLRSQRDSVNNSLPQVLRETNTRADGTPTLGPRHLQV